ncbi:MAG: DUF3417 domain-containing protein, partial [Acidimicrobiales bacterium]
RAEALSSDGYARARALTVWKERVLASWSHVHVDSVESEAAVADLGGERTVTATVALGPLVNDDLAVQLLHGTVGPNNEIIAPTVLNMAPSGPSDNSGRCRYVGRFTCEQAGRYGYALRVVPAHPDLAGVAEMGCVAWV